MVYTVEGTAKNVRASWTVGKREALFISSNRELPQGVGGRRRAGLPVPGSDPYVQVEPRGGGSATCTVSVNGEVKETNTATGPG